MLYLEQLEVIKDIPLKEGDRKVIQCPFCHGLKKLSLSKEQGVIRWNCFRASCEGKGIYSGRRNLEATKAYLANSSNAPAKYIRPLPALTTCVENPQANPRLPSLSTQPWGAWEAPPTHPVCSSGEQITLLPRPRCGWTCAWRWP